MISETKEARSKKSIEDVSIVSEGCVYYIDPKTHDINSTFSMPNLTSISKIKEIINDDNKEVIYIFVSYSVENQNIKIKDIKVSFIWELDISILGIGALGKGQLQIKNMNKDLIFTSKGKKEWYEDLKVLTKDFFEKQIKKIEKQKKEWE